MKNINQLRFLAIIGIIVLSVWIIMAKPLDRHFTLGLDLQGGSRIVLEAQETPEVKISEDAMTGVKEVIRNRIDALGVTEPTIQRKGRDQIVVELPGVKDPDRAMKIIGDTALLEFIEAEWPPEGSQVLADSKVKQLYGPNAKLATYKETRQGRDIERPIILKKTVLTGSDLKEALVQVDDYGKPHIGIEFKKEGAAIFADVTSRSVGKPIAIVLDGKIISAPNVQEPIPNGVGRITGSFTADEVKDLVIKLKAGSLPIPVKVIENRVVGPTLGKDSIDKSKIAGIIGFIVVIVFMLVYYRLPGLLADIALVMYVLLVFATLCVLNATLTLPGIAGILLSIGMAVDANVLIFERLKEEARLKKTIKTCVETSFDRAFAAILDSNVTTIIGAVILFFLGTGPIRGFAVTLTVGILVSMFTAIIITRMLLDMIVEAHLIKGPDSKLIYK